MGNNRGQVCEQIPLIYYISNKRKRASEIDSLGVKHRKTQRAREYSTFFSLSLSLYHKHLYLILNNRERKNSEKRTNNIFTIFLYLMAIKVYAVIHHREQLKMRGATE
jgi:hypothetical protein